MQVALRRNCSLRPTMRMLPMMSMREGRREDDAVVVVM